MASTERETHINIYDSCTLIAVVSGVPRTAWQDARALVRALARDAGAARASASNAGWCRPRGWASYDRAGFRAVNTFRSDRAPA